MCSWSSGKGDISQMIEPLENRLIIRKDRVFLYPPPMSSGFAEHTINNNVTVKANHSRKKAIYYDKVILRYLQVQNFKFDIRFQIDFKQQKNVSISNYKCVFTIETPFLFVPLIIQTYSVEFPTKKNFWHQNFHLHFFLVYLIVSPSHG